MGVMKDLYITIHNGGDEAVAAVQRMGDDWRAQLEQAAAEVERLRLTPEERKAIEGLMMGGCEPPQEVLEAEIDAVRGFLARHDTIGHQDSPVTEPLPKEKRA